MREHVMVTELFIILDSMEVNKLRTNNLRNTFVKNFVKKLCKQAFNSELRIFFSLIRVYQVLHNPRLCQSSFVSLVSL